MVRRRTQTAAMRKAVEPTPVSEHKVPTSREVEINHIMERLSATEMEQAEFLSLYLRNIPFAELKPLLKKVIQEREALEHPSLVDPDD